MDWVQLNWLPLTLALLYAACVFFLSRTFLKTYK